MPIALADFPRPQNDNGRGLHGSLNPAWTGGEQGLAYWVKLLVALNVKWFKTLDDGGNSFALCEKLLAAGIFPMVRILRRDPPPNDSPEPNPGHIGGAEEKTLRRLIDLGVRYFETNTEPNLAAEWKTQAFPSNPLEAAKLVALNWLFDARLILSLGGFPGLPAISSGGEMDLIGALATLGRQDILLEGCWIALHNYCQNRPLTYPDDLVSRTGQLLTPEQYSQDAPWVWWNTAHGRADSLDVINELRANLVNPAATIQQDHACFREFEYYDALAMKHLGRSIPIISTEGGYRVGRREDLRYPRITPETHRDQTVALYDYMQRQAPDYYFAAAPTLLVESEEREPDAWHSAFWQRAATNAPYGFDGIPNIALANASMGDQLPVIDAVKQMQNLARRMPGAQPTPPVQPAMPFEPTPIRIPSPVTRRPTKPEPIAPSEFPSWLRDTPPPMPIPSIQKPIQVPIEPELQPVELAPMASTEPPIEASISEAIPLPPSPQVAEPSAENPIIEIVPSPQISEPTIDFGPPPPPEHVIHVESIAESIQSRPTFETLPLNGPLAVPDVLEWDWRLDALGVVVEPAEVKPGQTYWKIVRAEYQAPNESNDGHQIFYIVADQQNKPVEYQKVLQGWSDGEIDAITNEKGEANIPMWNSFSPDRMEQGPYVAWVDGLASDRVRGLGLPLKRHVNFFLTFKKSVATFLDTERRR